VAPAERARIRRANLPGLAVAALPRLPEHFQFQDLVRLVRRAVGSRSLIAPVPRWLLRTASRLVGSAVHDVVLTRDEVEGLTANLLVSRDPPTAATRFSDWLSENARQLGVDWASELRRHYA
jgi:NADH dehydrogenase